MKQVKYPCRGCVYFSACGECTRTMPCDGRMTRTEKKKQAAADAVCKKRSDDNGRK